MGSMKMAFDWTPDSGLQSRPTIADVAPYDVLYDFDGPKVFISRSEMFPLLCYETDASGAAIQLLVVPTSSTIVEQLKAGRLSLRAALSQAWGWIVECDTAFRVVKSWLVDAMSIPDTMLPKHGYGIYHSHGMTCCANC